MRKIYGLLPAAGMALRMRPFQYPKELLPVHYEASDAFETLIAKMDHHDADLILGVFPDR